MPLIYKVPAYGGNALLLLVGLIVISDNPIFAVMVVALAALNLFLIYKLDRLSQEEGWLAHELEVIKMREQYLTARKKLEELEGKSSAPQK
jgi:protein-S-isoprenylcysteine O-methyltransferase Ste14